MPSKMTDRKATVKVCADGSCAAQADASTGAVLLRPNMTDVQWKAAMKPVESFPVVHLTDMWNSWGGFEDKGLQEAFTGDIARALHARSQRPRFALRLCLLRSEG